MADTSQASALATLHRLGPTDVSRLERELEKFSAERPIALILPCHINELGSDALKLIIRELSQVRYLRKIVVGIDGATTLADWQRAQATFAGVPQNPVLLWNDGPQMQLLFQKLGVAHLSGKGRNVWACLGYILSDGTARIVASHDCDITTYSRELLARLCYPVAHPSLGFEFCKGFIARYGTRLHGRVMRLLFTPLIRSLQRIAGPHPMLTHLSAFRYPLSGEMCLDLDLARRVRIPADWGVEVGMLAEIFHHAAPQSVCQSQLAERYDHKHQDLSALHPMAVDVCKTIFCVLEIAPTLEPLLSDYTREATAALRNYHAEAQLNGLDYDSSEEESAIAVFTKAVRAAVSASVEPLMQLPAWSDMSLEVFRPLTDR